MNITKATHKALLYKLFNENGVPKTFPLEKLMIASSAVKKLSEDTEILADGVMKFNDGEVEFTADEWVLLKDQFKAKTTGTIVEAESIEELKEVLK